MKVWLTVVGAPVENTGDEPSPKSQVTLEIPALLELAVGLKLTEVPGWASAGAEKAGVSVAVAGRISQLTLPLDHSLWM